MRERARAHVCERTQEYARERLHAISRECDDGKMYEGIEIKRRGDTRERVRAFAIECVRVRVTARTQEEESNDENTSREQGQTIQRCWRKKTDGKI